MSMFNITARLGLDGTTFQAGIARANAQVKGFGTGVAQGVGRALAPWFGIGMFSRVVGMMKQFATSGDEIRKKWQEMGIAIDDNVFNALVRTSRQMEALKVQIISAATPIISAFVKIGQSMVDSIGRAAAFYGGYSEGAKIPAGEPPPQWLGLLGPGGAAIAAGMVMGGKGNLGMEYGKKAMAEFDAEIAKRESAITETFAEKAVKQVAKKLSRAAMASGVPTATDDLAKIGGFSSLGSDMKQLTRQQLTELQRIASNTSELKGLP